MNRKSITLLYAMLLSLLFLQNAFSELVLSLPNMSWALEIEAAGFEVLSTDTARSGEGMRLMAQNKKTGLFMTAFLEKAASEGDATVSREYYWNHAKKSPYKKSDLKMTEDGDMALISYLVKEFQGQEINQKNINAYLSESGFWVDVHLSKVGYTPDDDVLFRETLKGIRINKDYQPTSLMYFHFGNVYFRQQNFKGAVLYYEQALEQEKKTPELDKEMWIALMDHLGLSYGISGRVKKAKEVYQYAISKQPEAPMLYYNLACAFAEDRDLENAITNLKLAFKHKANLMPGKTLPDPMKDTSFQKYAGREEFVKAVKEMRVDAEE